jgi:hypothetical protein
MRAQQAFRAFLKDELQAGDPPQRVELVLASAKGGASSVKVQNIDQPIWSDDEVLELAELLARTAQQDANGWGGACRYYLKGHRMDRPFTRSTVVRLFSEDDDSEPEGGEPATAAGILAQTMRHNEALARQLVAVVGSLTTYSSETIARLTMENSQQERVRLQTYEVLEDLISKKHERELEHAREERRDKSMAKLLNAVAPLATAAGAKFVYGDKAPPALAAEPHMQALAQFARGLTHEQVAGLMAQLGPEQQATLATLLAQVMEATRIEEEEPEDAAHAAE